MENKVLRENSALYKRIIRAENYLNKLDLAITYAFASDGICIEDQESGIMVATVDKEMAFPRSIETKFYLRE